MARTDGSSFFRTIRPARELTEAERKILQALLGRPFPGSHALQQQLSSTRVRSECTCGCATLDLRVDAPSLPLARVRTRVPVQALATDRDGMGILINLHVVDGLLSELEILRGDGAPLQSILDPAKWQSSRTGIDGPLVPMICDLPVRDQHS
jgi:hypothetical protein